MHRKERTGAEAQKCAVCNVFALPCPVRVCVCVCAYFNV